MSIFKPINNDLKAVNSILQKEYIIKAGHLNSFARLETTPLNAAVRPAAVILTGRIFNHINSQVITLAAIVQFIYLASAVHFRINEDQERNNSPQDGSQFPVLVGDYLYGKFFTSLCKAQLVEYLGPLSQVICSIHEGGILRRKAANSHRHANKMLSLQQEIAYKETGTLLETGCKISAELAGTDPQDLFNVQNFGREMGTAYGLMESKGNIQNILLHLENAIISLNKLPQNEYHRILQNLLVQWQKSVPVLVKDNAIGS